MDRIIQDLVSALCSWRIDMGMMMTRDNPRVTQSPLPPASSSSKNKTNTKGQPTEDPDYYRIMNRYPEHMLHCPQTSLYPIFFFLMERWEARRAASAAAKHTACSPSTESEE